MYFGGGHWSGKRNSRPSSLQQESWAHVGTESLRFLNVRSSRSSPPSSPSRCRSRKACFWGRRAGCGWQKKRSVVFVCSYSYFGVKRLLVFLYVLIGTYLYLFVVVNDWQTLHNECRCDREAEVGGPPPPQRGEGKFCGIAKGPKTPLKLKRKKDVSGPMGRGIPKVPDPPKIRNFAESTKTYGNPERNRDPR